MIKKIDIQTFGLFNDYKWEQDIGKDQDNNFFKDLNIIHGRNYSGKTTLSRIFRCIEEGKIDEKYSNGKFSIIDYNNIIITEKNIAYSKNIRVYNTDFIKVHLSWLYDNENGEIAPFTLLGSKNIEANKKIEEIKTKLGSIELKTGLYYELIKNNSITEAKLKSIKNKNKNLEERLSDHANKKIKVNSNYLRQGVTYIVTHLKEEINIISNDISKYILDEKSIKAHILIIEEPEKTNIIIQNITNSDYKDLFTKAKNLIEKNITSSKTLNELLSNTILQKWIDDGRKLHNENTKICAFCHGKLLQERLAEINAHFSKESEELQKSIENELLELEKLNSKYLNYFSINNIEKNNYYLSFQSDFELIKNQWENASIQHAAFIDKLSSILKERYNDIFNTKSLDNIDIPSIDFEEIINSLNRISKQHKEKIKTLEEDKQNSRKLLRYSENARFLSEIKYNDLVKDIKHEEEKLSAQQKIINKLNTDINILDEEKKQAVLKLNDEGKAANKINDHLLKYFGADNLFLKPENIDGTIPKTKFIVMRGNDKAYNLSEGESSLISFCYFIAKMEDELSGTEHEKLIIYIDDPISSLDSNHIFYMFSLIDTIIVKNKKYLQLFISTHNLDFLKYIQRFSVSRSFKQKNINHFIVEKLKRGSSYRCFLKKMPVHLKNYVTEYNYLFHEIYNMALYSKDEKIKKIENDFTLFYNIANIMRRFLECYLFYRFPNTKNPLDNMEKIFSRNIPSLVKRVINEYSHLTWGDRGTLVVEVSEAETVAKEIIRVIKDNDNAHFKALCESVGVNENIEIELIEVSKKIKNKNVESILQPELFYESDISGATHDHI